MSKELKIKEFTFDDMVDDPTIVMIAKRGTGKSWITKAFMFDKADIPIAVVISPTDNKTKFFSKFFPETYIYYEFKSEILERLFFRQHMMIKKKEEKAKEGKKVDARSLLIMDDCLASKGTWSKDENIAEIFMNGRHSQITYILTMQFPLGITPEYRNNIDYVFILREDQNSNIKRLFEHWAGFFPNIKTFREILKQVTMDHGALVIDNRSTAKSNDFVDKIGWYKAPNLIGKKVKFGCKQFRKYHEKNYDPDWENKKINEKYGHLMNNNTFMTKNTCRVKKVKNNEL